MYAYTKFIFTFVLITKIACRTGILRKHVAYYSNTWTVQISGNFTTVTKIAETDGFEIVEEVRSFPGLYHFIHRRHPKQGKYENELLTSQLSKHPEVLWVKQVSKHKLELRNNNVLCPRSTSIKATTLYKDAVDDNLFTKQWYMQDCRKPDHLENIYDINVVPVWYDYKIFGSGVKVIIIDDGVETEHEDLKYNYDKNYGYDLIDNDDTPDPKHYGIRTFNHGTKCAGVVVMRANNKLCGIGIAPLATLGAVRLLGIEPVSDLDNAKALSFKANEIDIMSNSWGPNDDGKTMMQQQPLTMAAFKNGIIDGRRKKGVIFVFAGGNGKMYGDMCGYDIYVNSIYTIAIAGADHNGRVIEYSERCSAIIATTYSGDKISPYNIVTTDVGLNKCTSKHCGTSAAAPMVAGALALVLEANPELTWREVQFILVWTCEVVPLENNEGWNLNKAGFYVSHDFGFGMINVHKMVTLARNFIAVPPMLTCVVPVDMNEYKEISRTLGMIINIKTDACVNLPTEINYIEHVQLIVSVQYLKRGDLQIDLISPKKTVAHLLEPRKRDVFTGGINDWVLDSVHMWGEPARGKWTVNIFDTTGRSFNKGIVEGLTIVIHGTKGRPALYNKPRTYYDFTLPDSN